MSSVTEPEIFPSDSLEEVLAPLGSFSDEQIGSLRADIDTWAGFEPDAERCRRLGELLRTSPETAGLLLTALSVLYDRIAELPPDVAKPALLRFVQEIDGVGDVNLKERLLDRLILLISPSERIETGKKIRRLQTGFIPNAKSFASFVDLRPDFTPDYQSVRGFVPMVQMRITTDSEDPTKQELLLQLDANAMSALKSAIAGVERKLATLAGSSSGLVIYANKKASDETH